MTTPLRLAIYTLPLVITLAACSGEQAAPTGGSGSATEPAPAAAMNTQSITIAAELFYRERIALPPGAVAVAAVEIAGSGTVVAESRDELAGRSVPAPVTLELDRLQLPQDVGLAFRGSIEVDGVTAWRSEPRPVDLTSAAIDLGPILLRAVDEQDTAAVDPLAASLQAGTWVVEDILGGGIIDSSRVTLDFREGDVAGRASCNTYQGSWSLDGGRLSIGDVAVTMMACPEALMNQERRFLDALAAADGVRFDETGALLLTSGGNDIILARKEP